MNKWHDNKAWFLVTPVLIVVCFSAIIPLAMPKKGWGVSFSLVTLALPLLIPWNTIGTIWMIFVRPDIGLLGAAINYLGVPFEYTRRPFDAWITLMLVGVWH